MAKCPECGADNPDEAIYCQSCYAKLTPPTSVVWREEVVPKEGKKDEATTHVAEVATTEPKEEKMVTKDEATGALKEAKALIKKAKDEGRDITEAKKVFMEAKPAYDRGDYAKVLEIAEKVKSMLQ